MKHPRPDSPGVSVVIPVYNGEAYLEQALDSVAAQTLQPSEVIVIDDGSRDRSREIALADPRVRYVRQSNRGTAASRNRGVALASGALIAFLDQDDLWAPHKLALQVKALESTPSVGAVFCHLSQFLSPELPDDFARRLQVDPRPMSGLSPSALLVRREAFAAVGDFRSDLDLAEWTDWYLRLTESGIPCLVLEDVLVARRVHRNNKGLLRRNIRNEYVAALRQSLQRRRARSATA